MGGKTQTSSQQVQIPQAVLDRYNSVNTQAQTAAEAPFQTYSGQFVAPTTDAQNAGIGQATSAATEAQPYYGAATNTLLGGNNASQPYYGAATGLAAASAGPVNAQQIGAPQINQFLSPYLQTVLGGTAGVLNQQNQQQQQGALGNAISQGAFGGDRAGIAAANLEEQQNLANSQIYSGILNSGFNTALGAAQQQQGVNLGAGQANRAALSSAGQQLEGLGQTIYGQGANTATTLGGLGTAAQSAAESGAQGELAAGQVQQQTQQAQDTAEYNQFLQQQSYPFQTAQFLANIAEGTGALSGSTTTTTQPGGFFSDERLKANIKPIGKAYDGQMIYSFRYKDDPHNLTRIGFMAQDVEKKHPEAVGESQGFKTVDYGKATEDAAKRGHFAAGGSPTLPGPYAGIDLGSLLAAQEQMYAPFGGAGLYGAASSGSPHGGSSYVPSATLPVSHLAVAGGLAAHPESAAQNMNDWANLAKSTQGIAGSAGKFLSHNDNSPPSIGSDPAADAALGSELDAIPAARYGGSIRRARGGLAMAYADGGMPYADEGLGLEIPDDPNERQLATAASLNGSGSSSSGLGDIASLAKSAATILPLFLKSGGRAGYDDGGGIDPAPVDYLDNPVNVTEGDIQRAMRPNNTEPMLAALAGAPGGFGGATAFDPTASDGPRPVTVADIAARLGPNAPVHVAPHPSGGLSIDPTGANAAAYGASPGAYSGPDPMADPTGLAANLSSMTPGTPASNPDTSDVQGASSPTGLAVDAGLPAKVRPDGSPNPDILANAENTVGGALDRAGDWLAPKGGFFDKLAQGKTEAVIPFLTALGAMGTAPTRSLGVALASGVGAGAQSYMNTQNQQANIARTQAQTGVEKTTAYDLLQKNAPPNMQAVPGPGPDGKAFPGPDGKPWHYELKVGYANFSPTGGAGTPTATGDLAAGKRASISTDYGSGATNIGPSSDTDAHMASTYHIDPSAPGVANAARIYAMNPELEAQNAAAQAHAQGRVGNLADVDATHRQYVQLGEAINSLSPGAFGPGASFEDRTQLANIYTTAMQMMGVTPDPSVSANLNASQIISKINALQGPQLASQYGERAASIAHSLSAVMPGGHFQVNAANDVLGTLMVQNQQARDFPTYYNNYVAKYGTSIGAEQAFQRDMGPVYDAEQRQLPKAFRRNGANPSLAEIIQKNPAAIQKVEKGGKRGDAVVPGLGDGFSRYFR